MLMACNNNSQESEPEPEIGDYFYLEIKNPGYAIHIDPKCAKNTSTYLNAFRVYEGNYDMYCSKCITQSCMYEIQRRIKQNEKEDKILKDAYKKFITLVNYDMSYAYFKEEVFCRNNLQWFYEFMKNNGHAIYNGTYNQLFLEIAFERDWVNPDYFPDIYLEKSFEERYGKPQKKTTVQELLDQL